MNKKLLKTTGFLNYQILDTPQYKGYKLTVEGIDPGIAKFYRAMIPKSRIAKPQMYAPHVSVVRKEIPVNLDYWGLHDLKHIELYYDPYVFESDVYYWLNFYSHELEHIREELGLANKKWDIDPAEGYNKCFHMTIANRKPVR